jgi:methylated-DNA-[protein]-cysteine S-methyltransferase
MIENNEMKSTIYIGTTKQTPLGRILIAANDKGLVSIRIQGDQQRFSRDLKTRFQAEIIHNENYNKQAIQQIQDYLTGMREAFNLPIDWSVMKPFQEKVLRTTLAIPRGTTQTYGEIAKIIGKPRAAQAVGRAEATNPIPIVIPCHRVIAANGSLHGYSAQGGLATKTWLLRLEGFIP